MLAASRGLPKAGAEQPRLNICARFNNSNSIELCAFIACPNLKPRNLSCNFKKQ